MQTVDVRGNRLRGLADWLDCPELCQELIEANGSSQMATMCWGATFSCRICQVRSPLADVILVPLVCDVALLAFLLHALPPGVAAHASSACGTQ